MSEGHDFDQTNDDDLEMLEAIRAAFGDDAVGEMDGAASGSSSDEGQLEDLIRDIDEAAMEGAQTAQAKQPKKQVEEESHKFIVVELGETKFGIPMGNVYEIQRVPRITFLPGVPDWVKGVSNLRGNVVSVVNLKLMLGLEEGDSVASSQRLVVTQSLVDEIDSGFVVDRVIGIRCYGKSQIQKPTASINSNIEPYLTGVVDSDSLIALLDIDKLLLSEEFRQFDAA